MKYPDRIDRGGRVSRPVVAVERPRHVRVMLAVLAILGAAFVVAYPAASAATDPQYADLELVFCTSSIDPKCQPQNLPILIEAGIISGGGTTATTASSAGGAAVVGLSGGSFASNLGILGGATAVVGGAMVLGQLGIQGQVLTTDPAFSTPGTTTSGVACWSGDVQCVHIVGTISYLGQPVYCTSWSPNSNSSTGRFTALWNVGGVEYSKPFSLGSFPPPDLCPANGGGLLASSQGSPVTAGSTLVGIKSTTEVGWTPLVVEEESAAISGTVWATVHCKDGAGSWYTVDGMQEVSIPAGADMPVPDALCNVGDLAVGVGVTFEPSSGGGEVDVIPETFAPTEVVDLVEDYPDCFNGSVAGCRLELWKIGLGGQLESCGSIGQLCAGWAQLPDPSLSYKCFYGPYEISLNACSAYRAPHVGVLPNVDEGGDWLPYNAPVPDPLPNATATFPGSGTTTVPDGGLDEDGNPTNCWPTGWGVFNPFAWVYQPIMCAAQALFVPRTSVLIEVSTATQEAYGGSVIGFAFEAGDAIVEELPETIDASCAGPMVVFGAPLDELGISGSYFPLNSCDEPMSTFRTIAYWALPAFTAFGLLLALSRYVAAIIGFIGVGTASPSNTDTKGVHFK